MRPLLVDEHDVGLAVLRHHDPHQLVVTKMFPVQFAIEEPSDPAEEASKMRPPHFVRVAAQWAAGHSRPPFRKLPSHTPLPSLTIAAEVPADASRIPCSGICSGYPS